MAQPSANEQYMLEMVNRARLNPTGEANLFGLADLNDKLPAGTITPDPKQPLAFNELLMDSSRTHSQWMIDNNEFSHYIFDENDIDPNTNQPRIISTPRQRMEEAGYDFTSGGYSGENIARQGTTGTVDATSFTEDRHEGLFLSSGHRKNILQPVFREVGIAATEGQYTKNGTTYNGLIVTQNFAKSGSNLFLTGVAYDDLVTEDDFYTVGEGLAGIGVTATNVSSGTSHNTTTMTAGGYQMALPSGTYDVGFYDNNQLLGNIEQITIGSENIKLDLNTDNIVVVDLSGDDTLLGSSGNDTLYGETGNDRLYGYNGDDFLHGGADDDFLYGHQGDDTIIGGSGSDRVVEVADVDFTLTNNQLIARGTDSLSQIEQAFLKGGASDNLIDASGVTQMNVTLDGAGRHDTLMGGAYNDRLLGGGGNDKLEGGAGNDIIYSHAGDDTVIGGAGRDRFIQVGDANFTLTDSQLTGRGTESLSQIEEVIIGGGTSNNLIDASDVNQLNITLNGAAGNDTLIGGSNDDILRGGDGNDSIEGNDGNDKLFGDNGDDTLIGGSGTDLAFGGTGSDVFALEANSGKMIIKDFEIGRDMFGLTGSLGYGDLNIYHNAGNSTTVIRDMSNSNQLIATVANITPSDITSADFVSI